MADDSDTGIVPFTRTASGLARLIRRLIRRELPPMLPAPDGIWHYRAGRWSFRAVPGVGSRWVHIAADPTNPDHWWLTGEHPDAAMESFDAGRTWQTHETG